VRLTTSPPSYAECHGFRGSLNLLEHYGPHRACYGTTFTFSYALSVATITNGLVCTIMAIDGIAMDGRASVVSLILPHTKAVHLVHITGNAKDLRNRALSRVLDVACLAT
jgi:hypothetical protein